MHNEPDIRLVDAHAKGYCGDHNHSIIAQKSLLVPQSLICTESGMIGQCVKTLLLQPGCGLFCFASRQTVDNAGVPAMLFAQKIQQLLARITFLGNTVLNIGPVKTGDKLMRIMQRQSLKNFRTGGFIRGCCQGDSGHLRKTLLQQRQGQIVGAEIMPPLRHTMRLVNGKQGNL